ncbi:MAG: methyltransferase domain-containing protein [Chitinophagaceae bacterium]
MTIPSSCNNIIVCLGCGTPLSPGDSLACKACEKQYAIIAGIPVLMRDTTDYLREMIGMYSQFISEKEEELNAIAQKAKTDIHRKAYYKNITTAIEENNRIINSMLDVLLDRIDARELLRIKRSPTHNPVFKDFTYLKRDWCGLETGESQINVIANALEQVIEQHITGRNTALVLGSGLGRLAVNFCRLFECVLATDLSFSMLFFFKKIIQQKEINFYEVNYKNILQDCYAGDALTASMRAVNGNFKEPGPSFRDKLFYFASDVLDLPLAPQSVDSIFSVYFTDVLSFRLLISRIDKCLKPGGVFVHFGPLGYSFSDISEMLAGNEIKDFLKNMGYEIACEDFIETNHLETNLSLQQIRFRNWLLVAVKQPVTPDLYPYSRLIIAENISYKIEGSLQEETQAITLMPGTGSTLEITPIILEIIQYFREEASVSDLVASLKEQYEIDDEEMIMESLRDLLQKRILKAQIHQEQYAG